MIARWCAVHLPKHACAACESGDCLELELLRKGDDAGSWITINGAHVHLNAAGEQDKGPHIAARTAANKLAALPSYKAPKYSMQLDPVKSTLNIIERPKEVDTWRIGDRNKIREQLATARLKTFNTKDLSTGQPNVSRATLQYFIENSEKINQPQRDSEFGAKEKNRLEYPIVARTDAGYYIVNGNHRAVAADLLGQKLKAKEVDLRS